MARFLESVSFKQCQENQIIGCFVRAREPMLLFCVAYLDDNIPEFTGQLFTGPHWFYEVHLILLSPYHSTSLFFLTSVILIINLGVYTCR